MSRCCRTRLRGWLAWTGGLVFLMALYLAAAGPWNYLLLTGALPPRVEEALILTYSPLRVLNDRTNFFRMNPIGRAYAKYVDWWGNLSQDG